MRTLADVRRRLRPGALLSTHYLSGEWRKGDPPPRRIVTGTSVLRMEACDWSNGQESRFEIPPASRLQITGPDSFIVDPDTCSAREYRILEDAP